jgi:hypothetical protein
MWLVRLIALTSQIKSNFNLFFPFFFHGGLTCVTAMLLSDVLLLLFRILSDGLLHLVRRPCDPPFTLLGQNSKNKGKQKDEAILLQMHGRPRPFDQRAVIHADMLLVF